MDNDTGSQERPYVNAFTERDCEQFRELALLHRDAKALILYSEEIDPDSRSNLQTIKELRDALDHLMRVMLARMAPEEGLDGADDGYCEKNLQKAVGHVFRAAFDALDGTLLSLRERIRDTLEGYEVQVIRDVIPDYWQHKKELDKLTEAVASHRGRIDVGKDVGETLNRYIDDVEKFKVFHRTLLDAGPTLDECQRKYKNQNTAVFWRNLAAGVIAAILGGLVVLGVQRFNSATPESVHQPADRGVPAPPAD
ncbi:MAG TPA: hypothetical protein DDY14_04910 [Chromatiaceae bacterium]|jgi:hypothetical protein|nr:MAG: hypothetical protein N838_03610 [Thiohalocapsa sp. PB-PSB1]QQO54064.1 MAG: hypothetical protein N838_12605 [Thiohalocapsa sp. PB-PSB1]HBG94664.1 hypothetical protein [Chromatiaceae bacterium]HCS92074.1 hypothetical protein [Chromatiaceae bacterium]